jgi:sugar phosphate isomerase/epimerase
MPALGRSLGFNGVELEDIWFPSTRRAFVNKVRARARAAESEVSVAISNDFTVRGKDALDRQLAYTKAFLHVAAQLGQTAVRILMGSRRPVVASLEQVRRGIAAVLPLAQTLGFHVAIENHDALSRRPDVLLSVLNEFRSPNLGVCLDLGNLQPSTRYHAINALAPHALIVHAKAYAFNRTGEERTIDYRRCFDILRRQGFNGPVVVEYDGTGDQLSGTMSTKALVLRYWKSRGSA